MKALLLAFFVGLAVATTVKNNDYQPLFEYLYHYDTQLLTGQPYTSKIYSGFRLGCNARVQFITNSKVRVALENVILYRVNEPIMQNQAQQRLLPVEYLKELTGLEALSMEKFLKIPFGFEYSNGIVLNVAFVDQEVEWSINIKRAFISMFQMNLGKRMLIKDTAKSSLSGQNWYSVMEQSAIGDCVTLYTVSPTQQPSNLYVTKTRDLKRCIDQPAYFKSIFEKQEKSQFSKDEPLLQEANMKYSVKGTTEKFIILSAISESRILFSPYKNEGQLMTSVNQTLYLRSSTLLEHTTVIPEIPPGEHKKNTLRMTLPTEAVDAQDPFQLTDKEPKQLNQPADVYTVKKIKLHLKLAAEDTIRLTSEHALAHLRLAIDMLKTTPEPIIKALWMDLNAHKATDEVSLLTVQLLWQVLPTIASDASANVVLDICNTEFLMTYNCTSALKKLALRATPTTKIIAKLITLTENRLKQLYPSVKQAAYLALGSLGYKMNVAKMIGLNEIDRSEELLDRIDRDSMEEFLHLFIEIKRKLANQRQKILNIYSTTEETIMKALIKLLKSSIFEDKILAIKAIGNSGMGNSSMEEANPIPTLKKYLYNTAEPHILRVMAVTAFRRMWYPEEVRKEAISILRMKVLDITERSEIRNLAFEVMASLRPELPIYETIADSLRTEKDKHVTSFIMSYFKTYANSTYPPHWELKKNSTAALLLAPRERPAEDSSLFYEKLIAFNEDYKIGGTLKFSTIGDHFGYKGAAVSLSTYLGGYLSEVGEMGIHTEGLTAILEKLLGPRGLISNKKSLFDLLKRAPRDISPQEMIDHIFQTLQIKPRTMPIPFAQMYFKVMGHELDFVDFTTALRHLTTEGKMPVKLDQDTLSIELPIDLNTMYDQMETQMTLPTESGIPVSLKFQALSTVDIKGNVQFKVGPYLLEEDRQGRPPVSIVTSVDLKPKVVFGIRGSMGIDMFYYKPVVGFSGLIKTQTPLNLELGIDTVYSKIKLVNYMKTPEEPLIEFLVEPFSQFSVIPVQDQNPILLLHTQQIFAPYGSRVRPVSDVIHLDAIGYNLALTGQAPTYLSVRNVLRPMNGRTLFNIFLKPMPHAPKEITFAAQLIYPDTKSTISPAYIKTYQEARSENDEDYNSGSQRYDRNGRPYPENLDDILPYSDPVNLDKKTITMRQLAYKFQKLSGKPMPFYNFNDVVGVIMTLDASSETKKRQYQMESVWASLFHHQYDFLLTRLWRNAIPNLDTDSWQAFIENVLISPIDVFEPKDVFDPRKQAQIMNELQSLVGLSSHKVINQIMNITVVSVGEQFNYPSMLTVPAYKVIESLVPEQLYTLMNISGSTIYNRQWDNYWETLFPLYQRISEERRIVVDRFYVKREAPILEELDLILRIQNDFLDDIEDITSKGFIAHSELPILQLINTYQMKSVYLLDLIIEKAEVKGLIEHVEYVREKLNTALANVDLITRKIATLRDSVSAVSQNVDSDGKMKVIFRPPILTQHKRLPRFYRAEKIADLNDKYEPYSDSFGSQPTSAYNTDREEESGDYYTSTQQAQWTVEELRSSLYNLSLDQMHVIKEVETAIFNKATYDYEILKLLTQQVMENVTLIDQVLRLQPILDTVTRETILLVTVQNEMLIVLLEEWEKVYNDMNRPETYDLSSRNELEAYLMLYKVHGNYLAERSAFLYRSALLRQTVLPYLTAPEVHVFLDIDTLVRQLSPQLRKFEIEMKYNYTSMQNPEAIRVVYNKFILRMDQYMAKALEIQTNLNGLPQMPKVYLVSEVLDALEFMKRLVEYAKRTLLSLQDAQRLGLIEKLEKQATGIQTLVATMSPIFTKYNDVDLDTLKEFKTTLTTIPINLKLLDVQNVIVQQNLLLDQIRRYLQNPDVSNSVLSDVLMAAIDRCNLLQETLKQNHEEVLVALGDAPYHQRQSIFGVYTQALNQQYVLYEAIRASITNRRNRLVGVAQRLDRISSLELDLNEMANDKDEKLSDIKMKEAADSAQAERYGSDIEDEYPYDNDDSYVAEKVSETVRRPVTSRVGMLHGIQGYVNISWGAKDLFDKNFRAELLASRTIEQMLYIFKQMNTVLRSPDVSSAINQRLSGELWRNEDVMRKLNSFNHLHVVASYDQTTLPSWAKRWASYLRDYLKVQYWDQYSKQEAMPFIQNDEYHAMLDISDFNRQWDLYLMSHTETDKFIGVQQHRFFEMCPLSENLRLPYPHLRNKRCVLNKDKLFTMDKVAYWLPERMDKCRTLLAMDCTLEKAFAATIVKSNSSYEGNILQILTPEKEIEIIPGNLDVQIRVNGKFLVLKNNVPIVYKKQAHYDQSTKTLIIRRQGPKVEIELPLTGIYFYVEGAYIRMEVSPLYQKKLCGLCSNYDNQLSWEFEGPQQQIYTTARPFVYSYVLHEGQCPMNLKGIREPELDLNRPPAHPDYSRESDRYDDIMRPFRPKGGRGDFDEDTESDPTIEEESCQPMQETSIRERRGKNQVCISQKPIQKCPLECGKAVERKRERVRYVCLEKGDKQVEQIKKAAAHGPVKILSISRQKRTFKATVLHEVRCQQDQQGDDN